MSWQQEIFSSFSLYGVTDLTTPDLSILAKIEQAYQGGVDIIQLRSKTLSDHQLFNLGLEIRKMATANKKLFFVNDRIDLALALKADGVHIGQDDLPVLAIREILKKANCSMLVGKSTHTIEQAINTLAEDVDYIGAGPIYQTPTKKDYQAVGLEFLKQVSAVAKKPFVAIGGIDESRLTEIKKAGGKRVAVVRALFEQDNVFEAAKNLKRIMNQGEL